MYQDTLVNIKEGRVNSSGVERNPFLSTVAEWRKDCFLLSLTAGFVII